MTLSHRAAENDNTKAARIAAIQNDASAQRVLDQNVASAQRVLDCGDRRRFGIFVVAAVLLAIFFSGAPASAQQKPRSAIPEARIDQRLDERVPLDLVFRDEDGQTRLLGDYFKRKPVVLVLAWYRCPRLCSLVLNGLSDALKQIKDYEIGGEFEVVTVSIDPRETPELAGAKKRAQVEEYGRPGAEKGWHFLTGDEEQIKRLADAVGYRYVYDPAKDEFAHASGIMILTPAGKISRYYYGIKYVPLDIKYGLEDAADEQIGSPVSRPLRLLCFDYDPATGSYSVAIMRLVRIGGALTVLAIGSLVLVSWRRSRQKSHP
jgi:protein SCO1/2